MGAAAPDQPFSFVVVGGFAQGSLWAAAIKRRTVLSDGPERVKKGCHCEEPLGDVAIRIPKMFPFWLQCVQNRKVLGNGLPEGELPEGQEKPPWGAGLRPSQ